MNQWYCIAKVVEILLYSGSSNLFNPDKKKDTVFLLVSLWTNDIAQEVDILQSPLQLRRGELCSYWSAYEPMILCR